MNRYWLINILVHQERPDTNLYSKFKSLASLEGLYINFQELLFLSFKHWINFSLWIVFLSHRLLCQSRFDQEAELLHRVKHKGSITGVGPVHKYRDWGLSLQALGSAPNVEPEVCGTFGSARLANKRNAGYGWKQGLMVPTLVNWSPRKSTRTYEANRSLSVSLTTSIPVPWGRGGGGEKLVSCSTVVHMDPHHALEKLKAQLLRGQVIGWVGVLRHTKQPGCVRSATGPGAWHWPSTLGGSMAVVSLPHQTSNVSRGQH